ncbi:MAG TPA: phosphatase PAP2 family protein [Anaeromyxobacteraceae bacterium]|nr:phosphatase PAP2 family protein [Anaeromyxobacteraceae bacterium]
MGHVPGAPRRRGVAAPVRSAPGPTARPAAGRAGRSWVARDPAATGRTCRREEFTEAFPARRARDTFAGHDPGRCWTRAARRPRRAAPSGGRWGRGDLSQAVKRGLARARPDSAIEGVEALAANPDRFSFPSGHTAAAIAVAVAFAGAPFGLGPGAAVLAAGIALSRVYLGAHYPLDVAAGAVLGLLAGVAARLLVG